MTVSKQKLLDHLKTLHIDTSEIPEAKQALFWYSLGRNTLGDHLAIAAFMGDFDNPVNLDAPNQMCDLAELKVSSNGGHWITCRGVAGVCEWVCNTKQCPKQKEKPHV